MTETLKLSFTYLIALLLIVGGLIFLFLTRADDPQNTSTPTLIPLVAGFIGAAVQFVFSRETQTSTAHATERAFTAGAASAPTVTTSPGPPATVTVSGPITTTDGTAEESGGG